MKNISTLLFVFFIIFGFTGQSVFAEGFGYQDLISSADIQNNNLEYEKTDSSDLKIKVYPNPATDYIRIEWQTTKSTEMHAELYDLFGRRISRTKSDVSSSHIQMDIQNFQRSAYLLKVYSGDRKFSRTYRIIKH
ncbi:MAG: T9SS type A sorting domain-containing protein [Bacteroidales bacterium]